MSLEAVKWGGWWHPLASTQCLIRENSCRATDRDDVLPKSVPKIEGNSDLFASAIMTPAYRNRCTMQRLDFFLFVEAHDVSESRLPCPSPG
jgi:hypothetical protein